MMPLVASRELQITLTSRNKEKGMAIPMCGVPYHAAEGYIAKLIRKGFKVAICEQMEDPRLAKKLVRREVTRVVTPGTAADSSLSSEENNFLARWHKAATGSASRHWIFPRASFAPPNFMAKTPRGEFRKNCSNCVRKKLLYGSSAPLFEVESWRRDVRPGSQARAHSGSRLRRDSPRRLDFRPRPRHSPAGKPFRRAIAGGIRPGGKACGSVTLQEPSFTTCAPRSAEHLTMWTASGFTSVRIAWCSMRSRCAISN